MGFFNAMSSIGKINKLIEELENQTFIIKSNVDLNVPVSSLKNCLNVHKSIHQQMIDTFGASAGARHAVYKLFGVKVRMHDVLSLSKKLAENLSKIIQERS